MPMCLCDMSCPCTCVTCHAHVPVWLQLWHAVHRRMTALSCCGKLSPWTTRPTEWTCLRVCPRCRVWTMRAVPAATRLSTQPSPGAGQPDPPGAGQAVPLATSLMTSDGGGETGRYSTTGLSLRFSTNVHVILMNYRGAQQILHCNCFI